MSGLVNINIYVLHIFILSHPAGCILKKEPRWDSSL